MSHCAAARANHSRVATRAGPRPRAPGRGASSALVDRAPLAVAARLRRGAELRRQEGGAVSGAGIWPPATSSFPSSWPALCPAKRVALSRARISTWRRGRSRRHRRRHPAAPCPTSALLGCSLDRLHQARTWPGTSAQDAVGSRSTAISRAKG